MLDFTAALLLSEVTEGETAAAAKGFLFSAEARIHVFCVGGWERSISGVPVIFIYCGGGRCHVATNTLPRLDVPLKCFYSFPKFGRKGREKTEIKFLEDLVERGLGLCTGHRILPPPLHALLESSCLTNISNPTSTRPRQPHINLSRKRANGFLRIFSTP